jgi:patatin-related protein
MAEISESGGVRELRLAVVLYGGVSLAIYMHGTTKEIHRLAKASALEDQGDGVDGETPSERVYQRLIRSLQERDEDRVRTRVVVDIIAGTSAGGINGIYLAKALAHNRSQEGLRDVWFERGDIAQLLRGPQRIPWRVRVAGLLLQARKTSPLNGDAMSRWLYEALEGMDAEAPRPSDLRSLMPEAHELELFVTMTDFTGYDRELVINDPPVVHDRAHRHVLRFRHGDGADDFQREDNGWLAFAARVTSSFPGAFPPVSLSEFEATVRPAGGLKEPRRFFRLYELSDAPADERFFVDGGVLDNRPFDHVIRAIRQRPAGVQVDRRLLYLEPDPAERSDSAGDGGGNPDRPGPIAAALGSLVGIPQQQPILDSVLDVMRHNDRVGSVRDIIEMEFGDIAKRLPEVIGVDVEHLVELPGREELARWNENLHEHAQTAVGAAYSTYLRSKVSAVVDRYARLICELSDYPEDCNQAAFVRAVLREWAERRLFTKQGGRLTPDPRHVDFLRTFDLDYGARRVRFVISALSWWYEPEEDVPAPPREALNHGKSVLYEKLTVLTGAMSGRTLATDLTDLVEECFGRQRIDERLHTPEEYADEQEAGLLALEEALGAALDEQLAGFGAELLETVLEMAAGWSGRIRSDLLVRYLGFPLWDAILYPVQSVASVAERDAIEITRLSPKEATAIGDARAVLSGAGMGHFGAFFDRAGRERDYLWGRVHGAQRLIGMLLPGDDLENTRAEWCREAFAAIAEEEEMALPQAASEIAALRRHAAASVG